MINATIITEIRWLADDIVANSLPKTILIVGPHQRSLPIITSIIEEKFGTKTNSWIARDPIESWPLLDGLQQNGQQYLTCAVVHATEKW